MEVFGNYHVGGSVAAKTIILPEGSVVNDDFAADAAIDATKCQSLQQIRYSQPQGTDVVDDERPAHVVRLPSEVVAVDVTPIVPPLVLTPAVTITTIQQGTPTVNEVQLLRLWGTFSGGTFTLTFSGQTTSGIAPSASGTDIKNALEALSNIANGDISTSGTLAGGLSITFGGTLAGTNVAQLIVNASGLTGASLHADATTTTPGVHGVNEIVFLHGNKTGSTDDDFELIGNASVTGGTFNLSSDFGSVTIPFDATLQDVCDLFAAQYDSGTPVLRGENIDLTFRMNSNGSNVLFFCGKLGDHSTGTWILDSTNLVGGTYSITNFAPTMTGPQALGGTWRVKVGSGSFSATIATSASAGTIQTAIENLTEVGAGNVMVTRHYAMNDGFNTGLIALEFVGAKSGVNMDDLSIDNASVTGGVITRAVQYDGGGAGNNEVQRLAMTGTPTQGTVAVTFDGDTATFDHNESAAGAQTKLRALTSINGANVTVSGGPWPGTPLDVTFVASLGFTDVDEMTVVSTGLWSSISTTTPGSPGQNERQLVTVANAASGTFTLTFSQGGAQTTASIAFNANAASVDTSLENLSNIAASDLTTTGTLSGGMTVEFGGTLAQTNVPTMTANAGGLVPPVSSYTVDVGLSDDRNPMFASILSAPIVVDSSSVAREPIAATITREAINPSQTLVILVIVTGDDPGQGVNVIVHTQSNP